MTITAECAPQTMSLPVNVVGVAGRPRLTLMLDSAGIIVSLSPEPGQDTVTVAAATSVEEAVQAGAAPGRRLVVVCDTVTPDGLRLAIRAGVAAVLRSADLTPAHLAAAVHGARHGEGRMPYGVLAQLLAAAPPEPLRHRRPRSPHASPRFSA